MQLTSSVLDCSSKRNTMLHLRRKQHDYFVRNISKYVTACSSAGRGGETSTSFGHSSLPRPLALAANRSSSSHSRSSRFCSAASSSPLFPSSSSTAAKGQEVSSYTYHISMPALPPPPLLIQSHPPTNKTHTPTHTGCVLSAWSHG